MARLIKTILAISAVAMLGCAFLALVLAPVRSRRAQADLHRSLGEAERAYEAEHEAARVASLTGRESFPQGLDVEATLDEAILRAADQVQSQLRGRGRRVSGARVYIRPVSDRVEDPARDLMVALRRRHGVAATINPRNGANVVIDLDIRDDDELGPILSLRGDVKAAIAIDERLTNLLPAAGARVYGLKGRRQTIRFKTGPTLDEDSALEDGRDFLARRITDQLATLAESENWIDGEQRWRFEQILESRYPRDVLIGLGHANIVPDGAAFEDQTFYHANVVWTASEYELRHVAQGVAKTLLIENREPWIKLGLSVGLLVLAILGWLRIDWWLKGHYSFLTKLACAMLLVAGLGLLWSFQLHA